MIGSKPPTQPYKIVLPLAALLAAGCLYGAWNDFFWLESHTAAMGRVYLVLLAVIVFWGISFWALIHLGPYHHPFARLMDWAAWGITFAAFAVQFFLPAGGEWARLAGLVVFLMIAARSGVVFAHYWRRYQDDAHARR
jgi:hypothetical protein